MDGLYNFLAQAFGPMVQAVFFCFMLLLAAWCICAAAYWIERKLIRTGKRVLWTAPFPLLIAGLLYGALRFSGQLLYPIDGWDQWGLWNYTNQNCGVCILFTCGCLLIGVALAMHKEKTHLKMGG